MAENSRTAVNVIERHLQSVGLAVLTALSSWMGLTLQEATVKIAALSERVAYLQERMLVDDRDGYSADSATRDLALRDDQIKDLRERVARLERR